MATPDRMVRSFGIGGPLALPYLGPKTDLRRPKLEKSATIRQMNLAGAHRRPRRLRLWPSPRRLRFLRPRLLRRHPHRRRSLPWTTTSSASSVSSGG